MTPEEWKKIKRLFNQAAELEATERRLFLADYDFNLRAEVEKMLAAEAADDALLDAPLLDVKSVLPEFDELESNVGKKIGDYQIMREIGRGGMGAVYEAVRADGEFSQRVAVKLIKRGMDSDEIVRRFRHERQILASLEHPNIARLIDGGVSNDGAPFYAMEFVAGVPVDEFCRESELSVRARLELFRQICAAVSFAHSRLVVHRDLKPSNILVTPDGAVKLLDFGIAKLLSATDSNSTATQFAMMTPAYASPEQIRGETVSTATDVYSLGVVLYELLTGANPHQTGKKTPAEIARAVCETMPKRPSEFVRSTSKIIATAKTNQRTTSSERRTNPKSLKGDLDNIVLKALKKESARRYSSVEQFSEDIRRHLAGLPVLARPDTLAYRATKFVNRNRAAVFSALFVVLALLAGISIAIWQAARAERERALAERHFSEVRQLANSFVFKYHDAIEKLPGSTAVREMLVKDAAAYLDRLSADAEPNDALRRELAAAYLKLGDAQGKIYAANVGDTAGAIVSYQKAADLLENAIEQNSQDTQDTAAQIDLVKVYDALGSLMMQRSGNTSEAGEVLQKALYLQEELTKKEPENADFQLLLARLYLRSGDAAKLENAPGHYEKALKIAADLFAAEPNSADKVRFLAMAEQRAGTIFVRLGDAAKAKNQLPEAAEFYRNALEAQKRSFAAAQKLADIEPENLTFRRYFAAATVNLAEASARCGDRRSAIETMAKGLQIFENIAAADAANREAKFDVSAAYFTFAEISEQFAFFAEAARHYESALKINREIQIIDPKNHENLSQIERINKKLGEIFSKIQ